MKRIRKRSLEINMIPYIDILLVLVLIFMLCASQQVSTMQLSLPELKSVKQSANKSRTLSLNQAKEVHIDKTFLGYLSSLDVGTLKRHISSDDHLMIQADKNIVYSDIMQLLQVMKASGRTNIDLAYAST